MATAEETVIDSNFDRLNEKVAVAKNDECMRPKSAKSPEVNCAICLGPIKNKSFTDGCFHMFCYICLLEWSRIKAECPLCKQKFISIIYNVRSFDDFDQYFIVSSSDYSLSQDSGLQPDRRFRYRTTRATRWLGEERVRHRRDLTGATSSNINSLSITATSVFRRSVYSRHLKIVCVHPVSRYRNISPAFFTKYPASIHRLVPWLNRELNVLLHNHHDDVQFVISLILDLIKNYDIISNAFREQVQSFLGRHTQQFCDEFYHFARSPYDLVSYDQHVVYEQNNESSSSDSNEEQTARVPLMDRNIIASDEDDDVIFITASEARCDTRNEPTSVNVIKHGEPPQSSHQNEESLQSLFLQTSDEAGPSGLSVPNSSRVPVLADSSDDDSDVVFIGSEKPWNDRSPIAVSSSDDEIVKSDLLPRKYRDKYDNFSILDNKRSKINSYSRCHRDHHKDDSHNSGKHRSHRHHREHTDRHKHSHERTKSSDRERHKGRSRHQDRIRSSSRELHLHNRTVKSYSQNDNVSSSRNSSAQKRHVIDNAISDSSRRNHDELVTTAQPNVSLSIDSNITVDKTLNNGESANSRFHHKHKHKKKHHKHSKHKHHKHRK